MGLIVLDADGNFDAEASLRANRAHNRMYANYVAACLGEPVRSEEEDAADAAEVLSGLAGVQRHAEAALRKVEAAVQPSEGGGYAPIVELLKASTQA